MKHIVVGFHQPILWFIITSCDHDLITITARGREEATTAIRRITGLVFSVPCAVTEYIPFPCTRPSSADPQITDFCQCSIA